MKISNFDAAKVIHEIVRLNTLGVGESDEYAVSSWENLTPAERDEQTRAVQLYLESGAVPSFVADPELFKVVVDALR